MEKRGHMCGRAFAGVREAAEGAQAGLFGCDPRPSRRQQLADLGSDVDGRTVALLAER